MVGSGRVGSGVCAVRAEGHVCEHRRTGSVKLLSRVCPGVSRVTRGVMLVVEPRPFGFCATFASGWASRQRVAGGIFTDVFVQFFASFLTFPTNETDIPREVRSQSGADIGPFGQRRHDRGEQPSCRSSNRGGTNPSEFSSPTNSRPAPHGPHAARR